MYRIALTSHLYVRVTVAGAALEYRTPVVVKDIGMTESWLRVGGEDLGQVVRHFRRGNRKGTKFHSVGMELVLFLRSSIRFLVP